MKIKILVVSENKFLLSIIEKISKRYKIDADSFNDKELALECFRMKRHDIIIANAIDFIIAAKKVCNFIAILDHYLKGEEYDHLLDFMLISASYKDMTRIFKKAEKRKEGDVDEQREN